jgi:hypothetical protein
VVSQSNQNGNKKGQDEEEEKRQKRKGCYKKTSTPFRSLDPKEPHDPYTERKQKQHTK